MVAVVAVVKSYFDATLAAVESFAVIADFVAAVQRHCIIECAVLFAQWTQMHCHTGDNNLASLMFNYLTNNFGVKYLLVQNLLVLARKDFLLFCPLYRQKNQRLYGLDVTTQHFCENVV